MKTLFKLAAAALLAWVATPPALATPPPTAITIYSERGQPFSLALDGRLLTRPLARQVHLDWVAPGQHWADFSVPTAYGPPLRFRTSVWLQPGLSSDYVLLLRPNGPQLRQVGAQALGGPGYRPGGYSPGSYPPPPGGYYGGQNPGGYSQAQPPQPGGYYGNGQQNAPYSNQGGYSNNGQYDARTNRPNAYPNDGQYGNGSNNAPNNQRNSSYPPAAGNGNYSGQGNTTATPNEAYPPASGNNSYPSQGNTTATPNGGYPPATGNGYPSQGNNNYPSQGNNSYPSQGNNNYPSQGNTSATPNGTVPDTQGTSALPPEEAADLATSMRQQSSDDARIDMAKQTLDQSNISSQELATLLQTLTTEDARVELAEFGYAHVTDPQNFSRVYSTFQSNDSIQEVQQAISTQR